MRLLLFLIFFTLVSSPVTADGIDKTILIPVEKNSTLSIENLYVSPQPDSRPLVAFYGEDEERIFIYDVIAKRISVFTFETSSDPLDTTSVSFVTFCWDQEDYGKFAAVFSTSSNRLVYEGDIAGNKRLGKPGKIAVNTIGFNYRNGGLYYVNLDNGKAKIPADGLFGSSSWKRPGSTKKAISDFKLVPKSGEPYYTLRDVENNDSGIYKGNAFGKVADSSLFDELYPHYSDDGSLLGYIERDKGTSSARICLKGRRTVKSTFTFALEENALLREYQRMFFVGKELYCFNKEPDLNSSSIKPGFIILSVDGGQKNLSYESELIVLNNQVIDILSNRQGLCDKVRKFPTIKHIVPFKYDRCLYFIVLTNPGNYRIKISKDKNTYTDVNTQAIVIVDSGFIKETP